MPQLLSVVPTFTRRLSILSTSSASSSLAEHQKKPCQDDASSSDAAAAQPTVIKPGKKRPRALTLPLQHPQKVGWRRTRQVTILQTASPLFALPFELRERIWNLVLGGQIVALGDWSPARIGGLEHMDEWPEWDRPGTTKRGLKSWVWRADTDVKFIDLVCTCRQIYSEAIDILYASNIFYFRNPITRHRSFYAWGRALLAPRLAQVRILILDESIGNPSNAMSRQKEWALTWRVLDRMTGLKVLYLVVDTLYPRLWKSQHEQSLLGPLKSVMHPQEIYVIVDWNSSSSSSSFHAGDLATATAAAAHVVVVGEADEERPALSMVRGQVWRVRDYESTEKFFEACSVSNMKEWIRDRLECLSEGSWKRSGLEF